MLPSNPEAVGYALILVGTILILIAVLGLAGWSAGRARRARNRARRLQNQLGDAALLIGELRTALNITDRLLADALRRYGADVDQHFDRSPRWTRPGPPADETVVIIRDDTMVLTACGLAVVDAT